MKRIICLGALVLTLVVFPRLTHAGSELKTVKMVIPRGSAFVLSYYVARDAGIFRKHGIEAEVDARPFAGFMAGLPSRQVLVGTYAGLNAIEQMNEGKDMVVIGGGLTSMQDVWVRKHSPLKKMSDLKGKKFGVLSLLGKQLRHIRHFVLREISPPRPIFDHFTFSISLGFQL